MLHSLLRTKARMLLGPWNNRLPSWCLLRCTCRRIACKTRTAAMWRRNSTSRLILRGSVWWEIGSRRSTARTWWNTYKTSSNPSQNSRSQNKLNCNGKSSCKHNINNKGPKWQNISTTRRRTRHSALSARRKTPPRNVLTIRAILRPPSKALAQLRASLRANSSTSFQ